MSSCSTRKDRQIGCGHCEVLSGVGGEVGIESEGAFRMKFTSADEMQQRICSDFSRACLMQVIARLILESAVALSQAAGFTGGVMQRKESGSHPPGEFSDRADQCQPNLAARIHIVNGRQF